MIDGFVNIVKQIQNVKKDIIYFLVKDMAQLNIEKDWASMERMRYTDVHSYENM